MGGGVAGVGRGLGCGAKCVEKFCRWGQKKCHFSFVRVFPTPTPHVGPRSPRPDGLLLVHHGGCVLPGARRHAPAPRRKSGGQAGNTMCSTDIVFPRSPVPPLRPRLNTGGRREGCGPPPVCRVHGRRRARDRRQLPPYSSCSRSGPSFPAAFPLLRVGDDGSAEEKSAKNEKLWALMSSYLPSGEEGGRGRRGARGG
jgi:hypothetical protein